MPTYEYLCLECDRTFERVERFADGGGEKPACPECKGQKVERVFSSFFAKTSRKS